jgi:GT2 family glycosyltransferase
MKQSEPAEPSISIIVPVHNGGEAFHKCLSGLAAVSPRPEEIIIVADGDTDGSWRIAQDQGFRVLKKLTNGGPARARNAGANVAKGDILFFVDADVVIPEDTVTKIAARFKADPNLAALFGSYDDDPSEKNFLSQYRNLLHHYVHQTACEEASTFWSGCGAIRREIFLKMGGFDENYSRPAIEDIELGYRLKQEGYRIVLDKSLQVKHLKRWDAYIMVITDFFYRALPWTDLILQGYKLVNDLNLRYTSRISTIMVFSLVLSLLGAFWLPQQSLFLSGIFSLTLLIMNAPIYSFFLRKRGIFFTLQSIPWHWFYYLYSGMAFGFGLVRSLFWRPIYTWICQNL